MNYFSSLNFKYIMDFKAKKALLTWINLIFYEH